MASTPSTLAQKLIARASGREQVQPGEIVNCRVDLAMFHDSSGPRRLKPMLAELGAKIWDPAKVVLVMDHYVPARDDDSRRIVQIARDWAAELALPHVYDSQGICHVVLPQQGHLKPGMFAVGGDSHSTTGGAFGTYMFGIGATEMLGVVVTGEIWLKVPQTLRMCFDGQLAKSVCAKDIALFLAGRFGMNGGDYQCIEYAGSAVRAMNMAERMTLSNMTAELGAQAGLIAPDETTREWLVAHGVAPEEIETTRWQTDDGAPLGEDHRFNASALAPQVALPHSPANARDVGVVAGERVDVAYIGACTGAKLEDLRAAAELLRGERVASHVTLMVAPASAAEQRQAESEGTMQILVDAGAKVLPNSCGACSGYGGDIPAGATVISSTARNFKGRMGTADAQVFLGSPYTVAASALRGRIADPREVMA